MGIIKNHKQRLAHLPHHILLREVRTFEQERYEEIIKIMDWLYDFGPATPDWFVFSEEDGACMVIEHAFIKAKATSKFTFAFRHRRDAIIFKLVWNKLITSY